MSAAVIAALPVSVGTVEHVPVVASKPGEKAKIIISHTGVRLTREVAYKFALDPNQDLEHTFFSYAGAARFAFNHHLSRVQANLDQRRAEASYGITKEDQTPALSWSKVSFINEFNAWKNGQLASSPVNEDGTIGLAWRGEVGGDVFECASVNAAQALANFSNSISGVRKGKKAGFPKFKSRHRTTPSFRLRSKSKPGETAPLRVLSPKSLRIPTIGEVRVHGSLKTVRRMLDQGRLHLHGCTISFEKGRWWVSLQGIAGEFNRERRSARGRYAKPAGMDRGLKDLAVVADTDGAVLRVEEAVRSLQHAQRALRRASKTHSRTKKGSRGRAKARARLVRIHARIANLRAKVSHELTAWCAQSLVRLTLEDLNVAGMVQLRSLAKAVSDAGMAEVGRQLGYKSRWYNLELVEADRWFASSKTCSGCGRIKQGLTLSDRIYRCNEEGGCGLVLDRDVNAAVNLARWPDRETAALGTAPPSTALPRAV